MGKFYDSDAWLPSRINDFHDFTKKYDPIGHYSVGNPLKTGDWLVKHTGEELADHEIGTNNNTRIANKASENQGNFGASATRAGSIAALIYGGMSGAEYLGGAESTPGGYEYIDSGTVVEGADPFSFGSGTDPNYGTVDFGDQPFDFGKGGMKTGGPQQGNPWMQLGQSGMKTMSGQQSGLSGSYGAQGPQEKNLGNHGLYQSLLKLVDSQSAQPVNQQPNQPGLLQSQSANYQAAQNFGLNTDDATMSQMDNLVAQGYSPETAAMVLKQRNGGYE